MWLVTTYQAASFTSLKVANATSTGGKSLLLPTPFAVKMALLDVIISRAGLAKGTRLWPTIRDAAVAVQGPRYITVNNTFTKVLKPDRNKAFDPETGLLTPMLRTIAFREYVQWQGTLKLALDIQSGDDLAWSNWLTQISYIGKRGGFIQALEGSDQRETVDNSFALLTAEADTFALDGTLQLMDDCGPKLTFEQVDIYSGKPMKLGKDRLLRPIILPYRQVRASRGYTLYERTT